ncbi:hydroxysqualene dehydroxylase HpnE [Planctopirus limnophila]|uniref:hydroxysqualene dehydroxylase HpnE n=1 Tax=Planctopirus limnophila TaxID=120 RepID=UPI0001A2F913|nr:hydroxysqualene dehydroxylase HpnE [Planctopirus limnophila]
MAGGFARDGSAHATIHWEQIGVQHQATSPGRAITVERVTIVGGGLAGMAAAAALVHHQVPIRLLESRPRLGGRASSFRDQVTGEAIDNCQHVAMGCCTNFIRFCEMTGIRQHFEPARELYFFGPQGEMTKFAASRLPAPLHLAGAFFRLSYLSLSEKLALGRALSRLAVATETSITFADWLKNQHQPPRVIDHFWNVVLVSALSESLDRIGLQQARKVFVDGFLRNPQGWVVEIPQQPLEELWAGPVRQYLEANHGLVEVGQGVAKVELCHVNHPHSQADGWRVTGLTMRDSRMIPTGEMIVALPWYRLGEIFPEESPLAEIIAQARQLEAAPISSVHLWYDRPITDLPHATFVSGLCQWLFIKPREAGAPEQAQEAAHYGYQVVISASRVLAGQSQEKIIEQVENELRGYFPALGDAHRVHARVVTEHKAVFSPLVGSEALRPAQQSPIANLQLAGDWTKTGWPATMEGAVRSGFLAAENVLRRLDQPAKVLVEDLPTSRLPRLVWGRLS